MINGESRDGPRLVVVEDLEVLLLEAGDGAAGGIADDDGDQHPVYIELDGGSGGLLRLGRLLRSGLGGSGKQQAREGESWKGAQADGETGFADGHRGFGLRVELRQ